MSLEYLEDLVKDTCEAGRPIEYSADAIELAYLANLAKDPRVKAIGEIGFNAGFSSYTFLEANTEAIVYSFDIGKYDYVQPAKEYIDQNFPNRHILTIGDSTQTVPRFNESHPALKFDLVFVDGGHDYETAKADILNMQTLATDDTILIIDDITPWRPGGVGPTKAWLEMLDKGLVSQEELLKDGRLIESIEPPGGRSWVKGRYLFS